MARSSAHTGDLEDPSSAGRALPRGRVVRDREVWDRSSEASMTVDQDPTGEFENAFDRHHPGCDDAPLLFLTAPLDRSDDGGTASSQSGGESGCEDELTQAIIDDMLALVESVPQLQGNFSLVSLLGEGTFSTVYKAIDLKHSRYDNTLWTTPYALMPVVDRWSDMRDPALAPETPQLVQLRQQQARGRVYVALKRIYVTSSPARIHSEIELLHLLRGAPNVAFLVSALRHLDQVVLVLPYTRHQDFRDYFIAFFSFPLLRSYLASLLRGLAATHQKGILHRDVKPANFLYDVHSGTGVLCDFGLAESFNGEALLAWNAECCHSLPGPSTGGLAARAKAARKNAKLAPGVGPGLASRWHGAPLVRPVPLVTQVKEQNREWEVLKARVKANGNHERDVREVRRLKPWVPCREDVEEMYARQKETAEWYKAWVPAGTAMPPAPMVGVLKDDYDRRPSVRANRAGTRGFRAPEVLLKCPDQTVAIDIWSVGIILLCFLTSRFPFFHSSDDTEALAELTALFGRLRMERCAAMHNRTFQTNIPTYESASHSSLAALVAALNPSLFASSPSHPGSELHLALDVLQRCLTLDCTARWTAEELLEHEFFEGLYDMGDGRLEARGPLHARVADWES